jgi:hypothetical protein
METSLIPSNDIAMFTGAYPGQPPKPQPATLTCEICGRTAEDVKYYPSHVGGSGTVYRAECTCVICCTSRVDAKNK